MEEVVATNGGVGTAYAAAPCSSSDFFFRHSLLADTSGLLHLRATREHAVNQFDTHNPIFLHFAVQIQHTQAAQLEFHVPQPVRLSAGGWQQRERAIGPRRLEIQVEGGFFGVFGKYLLFST